VTGCGQSAAVRAIGTRIGRRPFDRIGAQSVDKQMKIGIAGQRQGAARAGASEQMSPDIIDDRAAGQHRRAGC
jgi:hypothetical protein